MKDIVGSGEIGSLQTVDVRFLIPKVIVPDDNIRLDYGLGGGSTIDAGTYCINFLRFLLNKPLRINLVKPVMHNDAIVANMQAELEFPGNCIGRFHCSHHHENNDMVVDANIAGTKGIIKVTSQYTPLLGSSLELNLNATSHRRK